MASKLKLLCRVLLLLAFFMPVLSAAEGNAGYHTFNLSFRSQRGILKCREIYLWYPTSDKPEAVGRGWTKGFVACDGKVSKGKHPLILFAHGYRAGGQQIVYLMEALSRAGYIVVSTDHADSFRRMFQERGAWLPFMYRKELWKDVGVQSRREDLLVMLNNVLRMNEQKGSLLEGRIDTDKIGIIGYSLGAYTSLGLLGAVPGWKDDRFKSALLLAPFMPWAGNPLVDIDVPTMIQGGSWDFAITPRLAALYGSLPEPSQLLVLPGATHFTWTNVASRGKDPVELSKRPGNPQMIIQYSIAFFDETLKGQKSLLLRKPDERLKRYIWK